MCTHAGELSADDSLVYFLGIDGGGTKTEVVLADSEGKTVRRLLTDNSNPNDTGMDRCREILKAAILEICEGIPLSSVVLFAGISGASTLKEQLVEFFDTFKFRKYRVDRDTRISLEAGLEDSDGVSVILGTGICAWGRTKHTIVQTAGWGNLLDDGGSGYNIGRDGLSAFYCEIDGTGEPTAISRLIREKYPEDPYTLLKRVYEGGKREFASFAPLVFEAAEMGDACARRILDRNMAAAARVIEAAARSIAEEPVKVVISGGLTKQPMILEYLKRFLTDKDRYSLEVLQKKPVYGAIRLAQALWNEKNIDLQRIL
jgi:N-acetylglucosamine kinase-like BadF-type ATPase